MKKLNHFLLRASFGVASLLMPVVALAQLNKGYKPTNKTNLGIGSDDYFDRIFGNNWYRYSPFGRYNTDLMAVIGTIITLAFGLAGLIATVYIIMGGYTYITAGGNPEALEGAKAQITNSIIGLVVILISYLIIQFVLSQIGATNVGL